MRGYVTEKRRGRREPGAAGGDLWNGGEMRGEAWRRLKRKFMWRVTTFTIVIIDRGHRRTKER